MSFRDNKHWVYNCNRKGGSFNFHKDLTGQYRNDNKGVFTIPGACKLKRSPTSSDRRNMLADIRRAMSRELATALRVCENRGPADAAEAEQLIAELGAIKRHVEDRAASLGYSERCRQAIAVCRGECCRWHFPKTINRIDFFIAVLGMADTEKEAVVKQVQPVDDQAYRCPLLREDGCIFSFANRPLVCTNAFPCMAGSDYWQYKETFRKEIDKLRAALDRLIDRCIVRQD
jgi:hypothetical protein